MDFSCQLCACNHRSQAELQQHLNGRKHREAVRRQELKRSVEMVQPSSKAASSKRSKSLKPSVVSLSNSVDVIQCRYPGDTAAAMPGMFDVVRAMLTSECSLPRFDGLLMDLPYFLNLGSWDQLRFCDPTADSETTFYSRVADLAIQLLSEGPGASPSSVRGGGAESCSGDRLECAFFCNDQHAYTLEQCLRTAGFKFVAHLFWVKDRGFAAPKKHGFVNVVERLVVASRSPAPNLPTGDSGAALPNVIRCPAIPPDSKLRVGDGEIEKCEKPVSLLVQVLDLMFPNVPLPVASVADLCAGSASLVSAVLARNARDSSSPIRCTVFDKRQSFCLAAARQRVLSYR